MEVAGDGGYCASHLPGDPRNWKKRASDGGFLCRFARVLSLGWDWIDRRDVDKHVMAWAVFIFTIAGTWYLIDWTLDYAYTHPEKSGVELGLIVAAYMVPWNGVLAVLTFVIKWYFERKDSP